MTTITLTVTMFNGHPGDGTLSAQFDELGGLIGRADTNQLVLPDPDRSISRVHAQVVFRNNRYAIIDRGSNPILVNGQAAGNDREMPLHDGDVVQIGGYELVARMVAGAPSAGANSNDPFADLLGAAPARPSGAGGQPALVDPLAAFGAAAMPPRAPAAAPPSPQSPAMPAAASGIPDDWNPFAPDPVAKPSAQRPAAGRSALGLDIGAAAPEALIPELSGPGGGGGGDSIDSLFGLKAGGGGLSADPFAQSALAQPMAQPNMAANVDPLKSLGSAARATTATQTDALSDLQRPFQAAPTLKSSPAADPLPQGLLTEPKPPAELPDNLLNDLPLHKPGTTAPGMAGGAVLSWNASADSHTVIRPGSVREELPGSTRGPLSPAPRADVLPSDIDPFAGLAPAAPAALPPAAAAPAAPPAAFPAAPAAPVAPPAPVVHAPPPAQAASVGSAALHPAMHPAMGPAVRPALSPTTSQFARQAAAPAPMAADVQALYEAFREGLDAPELKFDTLTPELMRLIGSLLREAAGGTVDMLVARAALKRELRAEATMIVARENNPLKFSPTAEVALQHLLSPPARGFMAAAPAMRDAYADLRAHQYGMVAGMRAALEGVLDRFDPSALEGQLTQRSMLQNFLSGGRKAKLWEMFVEHFSHIRTEAEDDFQTLFGKAFLRAYEEHIDQIDRESQ